MPGRAIPARAMPHQASIERCTGHTRTGPTYGPPFAVRANFNGRGGTGRALVVSAGSTRFDLVTTGGVVLDDVDLPPLSRVANVATGNAMLVGAVDRYDQPPLAPFLSVTLAQLVA